MDDNSGDKNLYGELMVNNAGKIENTLYQMEQWSILSNVVNYVQYTGGSHLSRTAVKPDSRLARIFVAQFLCIIKLIIIIG